MLIAAVSPRGSAGEMPPAPEHGIDYVQDVRPIFAARCTRCHGARKQEAGLRLDAGALIRKGGEDGAVIVPAKPAQSRLVARITATDDSRMPPEGERLKGNEIAILRAWIERGAPFPKDERIPEDPARHWAFQPPRQSAVPRVPGNGAANPIDAFIAARFQATGCNPAAAAPRHVLLRRITLDLTGLPPTVDELRTFLADDSPLAYPRVVDRLLASPAYAERWARHWMDVWRYSDWYGFGNELRNSARHMWHWRDWIVESLAADKPYSDMLAEMLAADEIDPTNAGNLRATGFLARNFYSFNRNVWLDATVEHTSKAFLGITLNCARCHDHMYDPIAQTDYYRFRAIFEPHRVRLDHVRGQMNADVDGIPRVYDAELTTPTFLFTRGNDKTPDKEHPLTAAVPAVLRGSKWSVHSIELPDVCAHPALSATFQDDELDSARSESRRAADRLAKSKERVGALLRASAHASAGTSAELSTARRQVDVDRLGLAAAEARLASLEARIAAERARFSHPSARNAHDLALAAAKAERHSLVASAEAAVAAAELAVEHPAPTGKATRRKRTRVNEAPAARLKAAREQLAAARKKAAETGDQFTPLGPSYPASSSGRRLALARWIASEENPLTARVAVNHVWLRHFGRPLVPTVFDFGLNGKRPTHPELLDWLAVEFMRSGWSVKKLHRLIVLSAAYQRDSAVDATHAASARVDPDNLLLWRMNARRLESEAVRDSVLAVSGRLDRSLGGPELDAGLGETTYRRSIYYRHAPEKFMTFLTTFDAPSTNECYRRQETVVPQQALAMTNSTLAVDQSRRLARLVSARVGPNRSADPAYVADLFERVLCRAPTAGERSTCEEFLVQQAKLLSTGSQTLTKFTVGMPSTIKGSSDSHMRAREDLAHVLLNHNEFITIR